MGDRRHAIELLNAGIASVTDKSNPQHLTHAYQCMASACLVDPTYVDALYQVGNVTSDLNLLHASIACWRRALQSDPTDEQRVNILTNLSWRCLTTGRVDEALDYGLQAVALDPKMAYAWVNLAQVYQIFDNSAEAAACARKAYALKPDDALIEFGLGLALMFNREIEDGLKHMEARFRYRLRNYLQYPYPKWDGVSGRTIFLVADQGLGDTLSFARFVPELCKRAKYVHAAIQPELMRLFVTAFAGIPNFNPFPSGQMLPPADCWTTFVSLPSSLGLDADTFRNTPQIPLPRCEIPVNWKVPDRKLHIGIAWAGSPANDINMHRSIPFEPFFELAAVPGVQLYSLQVGQNAKDMHDAGASALCYDLVPYIREVTDTLAILDHLDLVISCESALVHICSAANKEVWVPYSWLGRDYRIGDGSDPFWHPKLRVFRQGSDRNWTPVFKQIAKALEEMINELDRKA